MKLAYLTSQYPATSHTFIRREVSGLRAIGVPIRTYSIRPPGADMLVAAEDRQEAAATFTVLDRKPGEFARAHSRWLLRRPLRYLSTLRTSLQHRPPGFRPLLLAVAHFAESVLLADDLARNGVTHLHNHFANSGATVGLLASQLAKIGWSFTMHGISETDYPAGLMLPDKIRAARMVACVSWFGRAQAMRVVAPVQWDKLHVVRCGLELDRLPEAPPRAGGRLKIICVGRLSPEKGHAGLLRSFAELRRKHPDVQLDLVGDGPDGQTLPALAEELGIADAVHFLGRLPEARTLEAVAASDILVLPSFMEGLPIVLMEAMALGLPVISSRVAGVPELVRDGRNGLLFTPSSWAELTDCLTMLAADPALRSRLGAAGRETVEHEFDIRRSAARLRLLFEELHSTPAAPARP